MTGVIVFEKNKIIGDLFNDILFAVVRESRVLLFL